MSAGNYSVLRTEYLVFQLDRGRSNWSFTIPPGVIQCGTDSNERLRLTVRKMVYRSDFLTISPGRNQLVLTNTTYTLRSGSPNVPYFLKELNELSPLRAQFSFDPYDGKIIVSNVHPTLSLTMDSSTLSPVIGFTVGTRTIPVGGSLKAEFGLDLAPPEALFLRIPGLTSSSLEVTTSSSKARDLLCVIGNDASVPFETVIYRDPTNVYSQIMTQRSINDLSLTLVDEADVGVISNNPITLLLEVAVVRDDQVEILRTLQETKQIHALNTLQRDVLNRN